jgi:hypothetical protein
MLLAQMKVERVLGLAQVTAYSLHQHVMDSLMRVALVYAMTILLMNPVITMKIPSIQLLAVIFLMDKFAITIPAQPTKHVLVRLMAPASPHNLIVIMEIMAPALVVVRGLAQALAIL